MRKISALRSLALFKRPCLPSGGGGGGGEGVGNPVMYMELNTYERNLPPAKLLLADDAIAAACAEIVIIIIIIIIVFIKCKR